MPLTRRSLVLASASVLLLPSSAGAIPNPESVVTRIDERERSRDTKAIAELRYRLDPSVAEQVTLKEMQAWYRNEFRPRRPRKLRITGESSTSDWTSDLTGVTYPSAMSYEFTQTFGDGTTEQDVFWLLIPESDREGVLHWIPGKTRTWAWKGDRKRG